MTTAVIIWSEPGRYGEAYSLVLTGADAGVDLSTTVGVTLLAKDPLGAEHEWVASFVWNDTAEELTITYAFEAGDNDVKRSGFWHVYAEIAHGGETPWRSKPRVIVVRDRYATEE